MRNEWVRETVRAKTLDSFSLGVREQISKLMIERMCENDALVTRYLSKKGFWNVAFETLARTDFAAAAQG